MLTKVEGMIVEVGSEDPPQIYEDFDSLVMAWVSLHQLYGVPVSDEEKEALIDNYSDDKLSSDLCSTVKATRKPTPKMKLSDAQSSPRR